MSESNELQARLKQKMIDIADDVFVLADHTKFGIQSFAHVGRLDRISRIITDSDLSKERERELEDLSVDIVKV